MLRHKFISLSTSPNGALALFCEYCGVASSENKPGCITFANIDVLPDLSMKELSRKFESLEAKLLDKDLKAELPHIAGVTTEVEWLQKLKAANELTSCDETFSRFLTEVKVSWWITAKVGKFPAHRSSETEVCQPFVTSIISCLTNCGEEVFSEPRHMLRAYFKGPKKVKVKFESVSVDCHSVISFGRRKPDIVCYAGERRGAMSISIIGDVKGCSSVNNSFPEAERGQILDMTKDLMTFEQPNRLYCYSFLTDGYRFQFFKTSRAEPRAYSPLSYQESAVYCGVSGWQTFFGLLCAPLSSVGFSLPFIDGVSISKALGSGCFCNVFVASDTNHDSTSGVTSRTFALKVYDSANMDIAQAERDTLIRLAGCAHVPTVVELGQQNVPNFHLLAVMPIGLKVLPCQQNTRLGGAQFCALLGALRFAHNRGIIHRDVKPDNIFLDRDMKSRIVLNDWGSSVTEGRECKWIGTPVYSSERPDENGNHVPKNLYDLVSLVRTVYVISKQVYPKIEFGERDCESFWTAAKNRSTAFARMLKYAEKESYEELQNLLELQL